MGWARRLSQPPALAVFAIGRLQPLFQLRVEIAGARQAQVMDEQLAETLHSPETRASDLAGENEVDVDPLVGDAIDAGESDLGHESDPGLGRHGFVRTARSDRAYEPQKHRTAPRARPREEGFDRVRAARVREIAADETGAALRTLPQLRIHAPAGQGIFVACQPTTCQRPPRFTNIPLLRYRITGVDSALAVVATSRKATSAALPYC